MLLRTVAGVPDTGFVTITLSLTARPNSTLPTLAASKLVLVRPTPGEESCLCATAMSVKDRSDCKLLTVAVHLHFIHTYLAFRFQVSWGISMCYYFESLVCHTLLLISLLCRYIIVRFVIWQISGNILFTWFPCYVMHDSFTFKYTYTNDLHPIPCCRCQYITEDGWFTCFVIIKWSNTH